MILQKGSFSGPALKINCGPPTANLWSDWSPQKRVNRDKLDQRQNVRKSHFFINSFVYNTTLHPKSPLKICGIWLKFQILTDLSNLRGQNNDFEVTINGLERTEQ